MDGEFHPATVSWNTLERLGKRWKCLHFCLNFDDSWTEIIVSCSLSGRERVKGIEPSYAAWEAAVLPLNYTRGEVIPKTLPGA